MNKSQVEFYIKKYRPQFVPIAFSFFALFIVVKIFVPQIAQFQEVRNELRDMKGEVDQLESSIETLRTTDATELDNTVDLVNEALPREQDIAQIVSSMNSTAIASGNEIRGYVFNPGRLYSQEEEADQAAKPTPVSGTSELIVEMRIAGEDLDSVVQFVKAVQDALPLAEIVDFSAGKGDGSLTVRYFYKELNRAELAKKSIIKSLKTSDIELLARLKGFNS